MAEDCHLESLHAHGVAPQLNITDWKAPQYHEPQVGELEHVSPRSRSDDFNSDQVSPLQADGLSHFTNEEGQDITATTSIPPPQPSFGSDGFLEELLHQVRKVVREEVVKAVQKNNTTADYPTHHSISSASGSAVSSTDQSLASASTFQNASSSAATAVATPIPQRPGVRFSHRRSFSKRPVGVRRSSSSSEPPADWGLLFDNEGYATHRLGQILGGLAQYMIVEYPPRNSLVVTPEKLGILYSRYKLDSEVFPFAEIFTSKPKDANDRIADFYGDLECQYHLVQQDQRSEPRIPALTKVGFAQYLTTCILAYPNEEFRRLEKIVADVGITVDGATADGDSERLPKAITRGSLPARHDSRKRKLFNGAMEDLMYDLRLPSADGRSPALPPVTLERRGSAGASSHPSRRRYTAPTLHAIEDKSLPKEYDPKNGRRRFTPGTLQTIGDESSRPSLKEQGESDQDRFRQPSVSSPSQSQGGAKLHPRPLYDDLATPLDLHLPPDRFARPGLGSRRGSQSQFFSQPSIPSNTIPPPPVGGNRASTSSSVQPRRNCSPPAPLHEHSASLPDISTSSASSSTTVVYTPSSVSSALDSPAREPGALVDLQTQHRDLDPWASSGTAVRDDARGEVGERRWDSFGGEADLGQGTLTAHGIVAGLDRRLKKQQRHRPGTVASVGDERGPTWQEVLRSQKAAAGAGKSESGGSGYQSAY